MAFWVFSFILLRRKLYQAVTRVVECQFPTENFRMWLMYRPTVRQIQAYIHILLIYHLFTQRIWKKNELGCHKPLADLKQHFTLLLQRANNINKKKRIRFKIYSESQCDKTKRTTTKKKDRGTMTIKMKTLSPSKKTSFAKLFEQLQQQQPRSRAYQIQIAE